MGGTNILSPIESIANKDTIENYPRTVILFTDGAVSNSDNVISTIFQNADKMKFCSVGIGNGISDYLIKNIGIAGKCTSIYVSDNENIGEKAMQIIEASSSHYIKDVSATTECYDSSNSKIYSNTDTKKYILKNTPFTHIDYLPNHPTLSYCTLSVSYFNSYTQSTISETLNSNSFTPVDNNTWHSIAY